MKRKPHSALRGDARCRTGFVLLMVLSTIALVGLIMLTVAARSLRAATQAVRAEQRLRRNWAEMSIRRWALDHAEAILNAEASHQSADQGAAESADKPFGIASAEFSLGGHRWVAVLADEQAKMPIHTGAYDDEIVESLVPRDLGTFQQLGRGRSARGTAGSGRIEDWFGGAIDLSGERVATGTQNVTVYSDGRINLLRASPRTLQVVWPALFGRPAPLEEIRTLTTSSSDLSAVARQLEVPADLRQRFHQAFRLDSDCYSLWLFCRTDRRWQDTLFVQWSPQAGGDFRGYSY